MEKTTIQPPVDQVDPEKLRADCKKWLEQDLQAIIAIMSLIRQQPELIDLIVDNVMKVSSGPAINHIIEKQMKKQTQNGGN